LVQGSGAAADIVRAVAEVNEYTDADVLIIGRGGGSIEDLWCFNEEMVARAVHASRIPVIAAVGHETDITLTDFAADLRAPTPSAAAELAVPDAMAMRSRIESHRTRLAGLLTASLADLTRRVESVRRGLMPERMIQRIMMRHQEVDELVLRMKGAGAAALADREKRLERLAGTLLALDPRRVLDRGYAVVRRSDGAVVTDAGMVAAGEDIGVTVAKGCFGARVTATEI
jgi:exodeoxyribonuclease VII large subunit